MGRHLDAQITRAGLCIRCQAVENLLPTPNEVQIGRVCKAFFGKYPGIRRQCLVPGGDRLRQREGAAAVLGHADADEGHDARAFATGGCRTRVQVWQHIGGDGARSTLAQRGAVDAFAGEAQHAWAKGSEEDRGVGGVNGECGTGGQLLANHNGCRPFTNCNGTKLSAPIAVATLTTGSVTEFSPAGHLVREVTMPEVYPTNMCFGGPDMRPAYITLSDTGR